jgi:hypothetical protein
VLIEELKAAKVGPDGIDIASTALGNRMPPAAAEECDAPVATGMMPTGVWR